MSASRGRAHRIAIDLGGSKIEGLIMAADGDVLKVERVPTPRDDYPGTLGAIEELTGRLEDGVADIPPGETRLPLDVANAPRIGIGTPGAWSLDKGVMKNCNSVWLNGRALLPDLVKRLGVRVRMANDADCFSLSEAHDGSGRGAASVFGVILGTGVGGGFVVDGRLLSGPNGLAGEWGHTPLPAPNGIRRDGDVALCRSEHVNEELLALESRLPSRQCYCGRLNCIETFLSGPGLAHTFYALWNRRLTPEKIFDPGGDDAQSLVTVELYCHMLARSLAQVINIMDPAVIVLGGGLSNVGRLYRKVTELLPRFVFSGECVTPVLAPKWGDSSGVRGAARLWVSG
ncbi:MAG: ROK family protein [Gammaproteobacteria bacterium]|nr:ROK family protein [Gammaproteobacteria bacterium]